ncbi:MAG: YHS domain-containing (seleno)protein, partial [Allomuricauda sp.]
ENLNVFKADPDKFVPQYGGYCAYAVAVSGKRVNVNPETFEIRDDKLYLFYNSGNTNTLELWLKESPEKLRTKADQNWNNLIAD